MVFWRGKLMRISDLDGWRLGERPSGNFFLASVVSFAPLELIVVRTCVVWCFSGPLLCMLLLWEFDRPPRRSRYLVFACCWIEVNINGNYMCFRLRTGKIVALNCAKASVSHDGWFAR